VGEKNIESKYSMALGFLSFTLLISLQMVVFIILLMATTMVSAAPNANPYSTDLIVAKFILILVFFGILSSVFTQLYPMFSTNKQNSTSVGGGKKR